MIEQTWWNTPWYRISIYLTNGRALRLGIIVLAWMRAGIRNLCRGLLINTVRIFARSGVRLEKKRKWGRY